MKKKQKKKHEIRLQNEWSISISIKPVNGHGINNLKFNSLQRLPNIFLSALEYRRTCVLVLRVNA